jgi:hypothetical protein
MDDRRMNMLAKANQFEAIWNKGYRRLCPIIPPGAPISERSNIFKRIAKGDDARGKIPGIKWPDGTWSGFDFVAHESTGTDVSRWNAMGAGVGIKTGNGLVLIDADTINIEWADIIKCAIEDANLILPVRIGRAPKVGYVIRTDPDFKYTMFEFGPKRADGKRDRIEILAEGKQFVAQGIHPGTGEPYRWPGGVPALEDVPFAPTLVLTTLMDYLRAKLPDVGPLKIDGGAGEETDQSALRLPIETLREIVRSTPNTSARFPTRETYRDYGYAVKAAAGPEHEAEGLDIFQEWAARWDEGENEPDIVEADYRRMKPPYRRGASWLIEQAGDMGKTISASQWAEPDWRPIERSESFFDDSPLPAQNLSKRLFKFVGFDDAASRAISAQGKPLIKGLLDQGAMTILYGPSNVGKTFVAMDLAYHVAAGMPYGGMRTSGGAVVYVAAEGGRGVYQRVAAIKAKHKSDNVPFHILPASVDLRRKDADLGPLIAAIRALDVPVALIVVDTLSRAMAGGDENSSVDMGNIVTHFDALRESTSAHLLVVHHTGKVVANGARGHSLLRAATDTEIEISDGVFEVTKQRDLPKSWSSAFFLDVVELGRDADGDPITSCTVRLIEKDEGFAGDLNLKEAAVYRAISELGAFAEGPAEGVGLNDVEDFLARSADKLSREVVRHALRSLSAKRAISKVARGKWVQNRQSVCGETVVSQFVETSCIGETSPNSSPNSFE